MLSGIASGYAIFLLKGFFDSLPPELYESAALDGAGEFRIFWQITMSLSKPILAVIALNAFTLAYADFIFALLICQDQRMWTLMVWMYDLQSRSGTGMIYASLLIGAIPTLIAFALCQKVIMRGIVVPVEK
ncbi:MAG: ABC transporter permease subunit [Phycisphaeraceae bacterium]